MRFIRYSLAANLILYGCERQNIITLGFISQAEVADIPSRFVFRHTTDAPPDTTTGGK